VYQLMLKASYSKEPKLRRAGIQGLLAFSKLPASARKLCLKALRSSDTSTQISAIRVLLRDFPKDAHIAIPYIKRGLQQKNNSTYIQLSPQLAGYPKFAKQLFPLLFKGSRGSSVNKRLVIKLAQTLGAQSLPFLIQQVQKAPWSLFFQAIEFLAALGPKALPAIPTLIQLPPNRLYTPAVMKLLAGMPSSVHQKTLPIFIQALRLQSSKLRRLARRAIYQMGPTLRLKYLKAKKLKGVHYQIFAMLGVWPPLSAALQTVVLQNVKASDWRTRGYSLYTLRNTWQRSAKQKKSVEKRLQDPNIWVKQLAKLILTRGTKKKVKAKPTTPR